jgi:hypothetical protein
MVVGPEETAVEMAKAVVAAVVAVTLPPAEPRSRRVKVTMAGLVVGQQIVAEAVGVVEALESAAEDPPLAVGRAALGWVIQLPERLSLTPVVAVVGRTWATSSPVVRVAAAMVTRISDMMEPTISVAVVVVREEITPQAKEDVVLLY